MDNFFPDQNFQNQDLPPVNPVYQTPLPVKPRSRLKKFIIIGIIVLVVALAGVGGVWGYSYYVSSPEVALKKNASEYFPNKNC